MEIKDILNSLGIPENNKHLELQEIIDSVLKQNHPKAPEVSDISETQLSMIDDSRKAAITLLNMEAPPFYSNIIVLAANEKEYISSTLFRKVKLTKNTDNFVFYAEFYIPINEKIETQNRTNFFNLKFEEYNPSRSINLLLDLIKTTKGLMSVSVYNGITEETVSIYDVLDYIQKT